MRLSPDGSRLAVSVLGTNWDIWIYDLDRPGSSRRLTFDGNNYGPVWSPDGNRVYFRSDRTGIPRVYSTSAVSSGEPELVTESSQLLRPSAVSADGKWLLLDRLESDSTGWDIIALSLAGDQTVQKIAGSKYVEWGGTFSPDGRSIAYVSDEAGRYNVYVKSFDTSAEHTRISSEGGMDPIWSSDGRTVFYNFVRDAYSVAIDPGENFEPDAPTFLFHGNYNDLGGKNWDYNAPRKQFILVEGVLTDDTTRQLEVITNWLPELLKEVPPGR